MVTDDERREVAERLRCAAEQGQPYTEPTLACFVGADCADIWTRLADLIDPDTTTDTTKSPELTTKCDREALLALADEMDRRQHDAATAATDGVVDAWCLREYARSIREACGKAGA